MMTVKDLMNVLINYEDHVPVNIVVQSFDGHINEYSLSTWKFGSIDNRDGEILYLATQEDIGCPDERCLDLLCVEEENFSEDEDDFCDYLKKVVYEQDSFN